MNRSITSPIFIQHVLKMFLKSELKNTCFVWNHVWNLSLCLKIINIFTDPAFLMTLKFRLSSFAVVSELYKINNEILIKRTWVFSDAKCNGSCKQRWTRSRYFWHDPIGWSQMDCRSTGIFRANVFIYDMLLRYLYDMLFNINSKIQKRMN